MDEEYTKAVGQVFIELFKEGLIYRGRRMVNWCPVSLTALSDEEVIMTEQKSKLYTVLYKLEDGSGALHVATTRPETIMADVAVAVNPKDPRYAHLIGKNVMRPLNPTPIPIIGDEYVEIEFGTGALKITPAHDKADFEIGRKFNLEIIDILTPDGHINCPEVPELHGMDRFDARRKSVEMLEASGLMVNIEDYDNKVGFSERANVPIEPRLSMQWFLKYPCVKEAADAVAEGDITFRPARWAKTLRPLAGKHSGLVHLPANSGGAIASPSGTARTRRKNSRTPRRWTPPHWNRASSTWEPNRLRTRTTGFRTTT